MNATFPRRSTIERANEHMQKAIFGPMTEGASQVAGHLSPFGMTWMSFVPAPLWPAYLTSVYIQGSTKGLLDAPKHYLEAVNLYVRAATEGARAAVG